MGIIDTAVCAWLTFSIPSVCTSLDMLRYTDTLELDLYSLVNNNYELHRE